MREIVSPTTARRKFSQTAGPRRRAFADVQQLQSYANALAGMTEAPVEHECDAKFLSRLQRIIFSGVPKDAARRPHRKSLNRAQPRNQRVRQSRAEVVGT